MKPLLNFIRFVYLQALFLAATARAWLRIRAARARAPRGYDCTATAAPVSPTPIGKLTIVWGTAPGGTAIAPAAGVFGTFIVTSIDIDPVNPKAVADIENENGSCISSIYLDDGFEAKVTGILDTGLTYPAQASSVTLTLPTKGSGANYPDLASTSNAHSTFPCTVESNPLKFERKKEAYITFNISHRPGRDGAAS